MTFWAVSSYQSCTIAPSIDVSRKARSFQLTYKFKYLKHKQEKKKTIISAKKIYSECMIYV